MGGSPVRLLVVLLALFLSVQLARDAYSWFAYRDERDALRGMSGALEEAGVALMRTGLEVDSLRARVLEMDRQLDRSRAALEVYERQAVGGGIPADLYGAYRRDLDRYNAQVAERNAVLRTLEAEAVRNRAAAHRYNRLADSIRSLARRMGDPYYQVPSPAELAVKHGLKPRPMAPKQ